MSLLAGRLVPTDAGRHGALLDEIRQGIEKLGETEANVTLEDLGPVEEFHIGGRQASADRSQGGLICA